MLKRYLLLLSVVFYCISAPAQQPKKPNSSDIYESIKKLNFLGTVLYIAAHPDDENTRLISYLSNEVKARTGYLSLTRGDGGQNLIGPELRELLGVIRTQELLAARRIDGGEQFFTRANDFGYSKHPDETLAIWNKDAVLSDVVWAIRKFRPDIIINRFDHRSPGSTHGHHTSSAMLSFEAFDLANDKNAYPSQLEYTSTWQPKREFFNTSWWFYGSQEKFEQADKTNLCRIDTGVFFPSSGLSNPEIAALSRSSHRSQGFGSTGSRGEQIEYIELIKGDMPKDNSNIFDGIDTSWNRVKGGKAIGEILAAVQETYDFKNPSASIPQLLEAYKLIEKLEDPHWKSIKLNAIKEVIAACAGLYLEAVAGTNQVAKNQQVALAIEAINRSQTDILLKNIVTSDDGLSMAPNQMLKENQSETFAMDFHITPEAHYTTPYWLREKGSLGMYKVERPQWIGMPETARSATVRFDLLIDGTPISYTKPIVYKTNDPVKGELYKPFEIIPEASVAMGAPVILFETDRQKDLKVIVKAGRDHLQGFVEIAHPEHWSVFPGKQKIDIKHQGETQTLVFTIVPPKEPHEGLIVPKVHVGSAIYSKELIEMDYDHIPLQTVLLPSESKVVRLDLKKKGETIGYIEGAGDAVPESLRQIGYQVVTIDPETISPETLNRFDAIVLGIRAYNIVETLQYKQQQLFDYVEQGGNLIVQYNTSRGLIVDPLAPYSLELSRDRVTDENSEVRFLNPDHELLNYPNKITQNDFENWVQERGLYFPDAWGKAFTPILSMNDDGETPKDGSLLVATYGKGHYIYTGLSFFRELPQGVPGAYKLFANMLSIGKERIPADKKLDD